jgi:Tfp pilus assembly protein PilX
MRQYVSYLKNESGVALVTSLVILVLLTALGTYAINMTEVEQTVAANLRASKQAFYLAEAGLERGRQQVLTNTAMPPAPIGSTQSLNMGNAAGSYTVTFPNIMPQATAWQYRVTVESTGNVGTASKILQALVTKIYDASEGAISMRGNEAHSDFTGNAFLVDGRDYDHLAQTDTLTTVAPQLGISVENTALESVVKGALSSQQEDNIKGSGGTATDPSVGVSSSLPSSSITSLANAICNAAPSSNKFNTPNNGTLTFNGSTTFGTRTSPQIYCIDGVGTPGNMEVEVKGNFSGAGVLVVRSADLVAKGNFKYEGLIIVTGDKIGFGMIGGGQQDVYGSIMINETSTDGPSYRELVLQGNAAVKRSQSALAYARQLIPLASMSSIISTFPVSVQQISWTEVKQN